MLRIYTAGLLLLGFSAVSFCDDVPKKEQPTNPMFEKLKKIAGTWVEADADGKPTEKVASIVRLTAGGSAIHETQFPGQPMEMVSVYFIDKGNLMMSHYCALGNQPRMKADPSSPANQIRWVFDGGTNFDPAKDAHMHSAVLTFVDDDHIQIEGEGWEGGKPSDKHCGVMKLVRKK